MHRILYILHRPDEGSVKEPSSMKVSSDLMKPSLMKVSSMKVSSMKVSSMKVSSDLMKVSSDPAEAPWGQKTVSQNR